MISRREFTTGLLGGAMAFMMPPLTRATPKLLQQVPSKILLPKTLTEATQYLSRKLEYSSIARKFVMIDELWPGHYLARYEMNCCDGKPPYALDRSHTWRLGGICNTPDEFEVITGESHWWPDIKPCSRAHQGVTGAKEVTCPTFQISRPILSPRGQISDNEIEAAYDYYANHEMEMILKLMKTVSVPATVLSESPNWSGGFKFFSCCKKSSFCF
jgi:hypothetical protein